MPAFSSKPSQAEYAPFYSSYIDLIDGQQSVVDYLRQAADDSMSMLRTLTPDQWMYAYAPGKWTVKELWLHVIDAERIFGTRALRIGRNDVTPLPGFDQNEYVPQLGANDRTPASLIEEYNIIRRSTILLFQHMDESKAGIIGEASGGPISPRALAFIIAGHEEHHKRILQEKYGIKK